MVKLNSVANTFVKFVSFVMLLVNNFKERGIIKGQGQTIEILEDDKLESICKCESLATY